MRSYLSILIILTFIVGCNKKPETTSDTAAEQRMVSVKVATAEERTISDVVNIMGEIIPRYHLDIYPKANGIVVSEAVAIGSKVQKDQVLAQIKQDIPGMDFSLVKVEATNSGVITMDAAEVGATVAMQRPIYSISQLDQVYMEGKVHESFIASIGNGSPAVVTVDAYPGTTFEGKIVEINPLLDRLSRTASVKILLPNSRLMLKPGMFAQAQLSVGAHAGILVPLDAIVSAGVRRLIFRVHGQTAEQVPVVTGVIDQDRIEVAGSISAGDQVVIFGQNLLEDGSLIRIVED